jgi:hypothetical protein
MNPSTRGLLALGGAVLLALLPLLAATGSYWILLLFPVFGIVAVATLGDGTSRFVVSRKDLERATGGVVVVGLFVYAFLLYGELGPSSGMEVLGWLVALVAVGVSAFAMTRPGGGVVPTVVFFVAYTVTALWVLSANHPIIDVAVFQQHASAALGEGINPYAITFPDIYGASSHLAYGEGVSVDGILQFGFPYLPLGLLVVAPFEWVLSDFRVAHVLALVAASVLMTQFGGGRVSRAAAVGFLLISPSLHVVVLGWTEPLLVLALALVLYVNGKSARATPYVLGLVIALKQYAVLLLAPSLLLRSRPWSARQIGLDLAKAGSVVILVTLPFFLWNPEAFFRSVVELQFLQPFRFDSIALPALWAEYFGEPSGWAVVLVPLLGVASVTVAVWRRAPTGSQGFALASALTLLVAFALSKQAFVNYYLGVVALLFSAAALAGEQMADPEALTEEVQSALPVESGSARSES